MKIFITSDHHFNHENIIKYCKRPFSSVEEMNYLMIKKWNEKVGKKDVVIHLGDFCLGNREMIRAIRKRLNGIIILIKGNHDYKITEDLDFIIINGNLQIGKIILSHRPLPIEELPKGFINIHGHIHEKESYYGVNVSVDKTNFELIELNVKNKEKEKTN